MFSTETRCIYRKNQVAEVICQLRFPDILTINANQPAVFQDLIRDEFPQFSERAETPAPRIAGIPGNYHIENQKPTPNYQFVSADGMWRINLTSRFISLACTNYTCWEEFAKKLDKPLVSFIQVYKPAYFQRIGLRYMNFISRKNLDLESIPFSKLFQPAYLGILNDREIYEQETSRNCVDAEFSIQGGCRAKIHAGPGIVKQNGHTDNEIRFIFDQDLFMTGNIPVNYSAGALETLHKQAYPIFRGAITDELHYAMDPIQIQ